MHQNSDGFARCRGLRLGGSPDECWGVQAVSGATTEEGSMVCSLQVSRGVGGSIGLESDPRDRRPRLKVGSRALPPRRKVNHRPGSQEPQTVEPPVPVLATPSRGGAPTKEQEVSIFAIRVGRAGSLLLPFTVIPPSRRIFGSSQRWTRAVPLQPGGRRAG